MDFSTKTRREKSAQVPCRLGGWKKRRRRKSEREEDVVGVDGALFPIWSQR